MNSNLLKTTVFLTFIIPFILQKSIFPFYRFGMFAEPVVNQIQTEKFEVLIEYTKQKKEVFNAQERGLYESIFSYLMRNYYYRKQTQDILQIAADQIPEENIKLYFLRYSDENAQADTVSSLTK
ncbi:MAG: hypothetical protein CMO01_16085 [Thalassobius sp.]|nr:hypothetical protein [Thalassovita sp.]|tara:strand:+ start:133 stop:504 length:372 start_codon:yes stop_codon:yes gene_type:complete